MSELCTAILAAISVQDDLEDAMDCHLPVGDSLTTTLSSPQFLQALSMFWSALQSGQVAPIVQQFGLGIEAVAAAADGNIDHFITALETEGTSYSNTNDIIKNLVLESDTENKTTESAETGQQSRESTGDQKKGDDDEGMAVD